MQATQSMNHEKGRMNPQEYRQDFIEKYPKIEQEDLLIKSAKFWDFYNSGGKEKMKEAGIVVIKKDQKWYLHLQALLPSQYDELKFSNYMKDYDTTCPSCGSKRVMQITECNNGSYQYRVRCEGFFRNSVFHQKHLQRRKCCEYIGADPIPHVVAKRLINEGIKCVEGSTSEL